MTIDGTSALAAQPAPIDVTRAVARVKALQNIVRALRADVLTEDHDYGVIPGTGDKPTLLLPGMEKFLQALRLRPEYHLLSSKEDFDKPLFHYRYECRLYEIDTGLCVSTAIGSANSMEKKWGWRWVSEHDILPSLDKATLVSRNNAISEFAFAIEKAETSGQYGKPAEYWQQFQNAIDNGTAKAIKKTTRSGKELDAYEIGGAQYRIPNYDIFDQTNTIDKIAQKRALGSAIKNAAGASEYFTVDLEDHVIYDLAPHHSNDHTEHSSSNFIPDEVINPMILWAKQTDIVKDYFDNNPDAFIHMRNVIMELKAQNPDTSYTPNSIRPAIVDYYTKKQAEERKPNENGNLVPSEEEAGPGTAPPVRNKTHNGYANIESDYDNPFID